mgnify:CR=1 FL=1
MIMEEYKLDSSCFALIMTGGRGERFWPLSTPDKPKPFLKLFDGKSLIQLTVERLQKLFDNKSIFLVLSKEHYPIASKQLKNIPKSNFIIEPIGKDTAPCASYASLYISKIYPNPNIFVFPSDHYIQDEIAFMRCMYISYLILKNKNAIITFGIKPIRPDNNYGYIEIDNKIYENDYYYYQVKKFKEKPSIEIAKQYIADGNHFWNAGIFAWNYNTLMNSIALYTPDIHCILDEINKNWGKKDFQSFLEKIYYEFPSISVDYAIMEKTKPIYMIPTYFKWDDIGTWASLERIFLPDQYNNIIFGTVNLFDTSNSIIYNKKTNLLVLGVKNIIFINYKNNILLADKKYANELKNYLKKCSNKKK